jgi:beta-lactamase regulating signal transducer with metallopeptidase domain
MTESIQAIAQIASTALISSIWQGTVLAMMIWLCLKIAPRTTASVRFVIWSALFIAMALLPMVSSLVGHNGAVRAAATVHMGGPVISLDSRWALGIAAFWLIFAAMRFLILARNAFRINALWKRSTPVEVTPTLQSILGEQQARRATLCSSQEIEQPCVIGFFAPRILIPSWLFDSATSSEIEQIVLHEAAHLRRFDDWTNLVQKLAVACFPLNPALLWIERRLCAERELACDESVVRATNAPRAYATCLTNLAEQKLSRRRLTLSGALSLGAWERRSQLAGRIESILLGKASLGPRKARALTLALIVAIVGCAVKLGGAAQVVSFSSPQPDPYFAQTNRSLMAGPHYQDVVFHPQSTTATTLEKPTLDNDPASVKPIKPGARPAPRNSIRRVKSLTHGVESVVIVTRWRNSSGQQLTVFDQIVRISALSAAQSQGGWFVVQL